MGFIIRLFGLKGSFTWACRQMDKGCIVRRETSTGTVKYRFDLEGQQRIQWSFDSGVDIPESGWDNANIFMGDILSTDWQWWELR